MASVDRGCLVLADISGYTKYLTGVELEHSHDVLTDLVSVIAEQMRGVLHLAKLEGDAVFCYGPEGDADGSMLLTMVESCYLTFARRVQTIHLQTTCQCDACRLIPRLNLKFLTHYGEYVQEMVAGSRELVGGDVVLAHRLLKNSVTQQTGLRGYAFFTQRCLDRFAIDPQPLGMIPYKERFEDVGEVAGYVHNLERRWQEEQERRIVYVPKEVPGLEYDVPVPPPIVWDYFTSPTKRLLWQVGIQRVDQHNPQGVRGVGTTNHCVHGKATYDEEILDWKPFRYFSFRFRLQVLGEFLMTVELTPLSDGTRSHVSRRLVPRGGRWQRLLLRVFEGKMRQIQARRLVSRDNLIRILSTLPVDASATAPSPV